MDEHVLVVVLSQPGQPVHHRRVCLKPRYKILRPHAQVTDQLEWRFRELERPHPCGVGRLIPEAVGGVAVQRRKAAA